MQKPHNHPQEEARLMELESYSILDTIEEEDYDNLTQLAAQICETPISLISLVDDKRQWFKSHTGLDATETPKDLAFCAHAINREEDFFVVQDARKDIRFHDNPLVTEYPNVVFYAGIPLVGSHGLPLGTLCVIDHKPKVLRKQQLKSLKSLANQVAKLLELRRVNLQLEEALAIIDSKNKQLERFASLAAHDLKSPLISISSLLEHFIESYDSVIDGKGKEILQIVQDSSAQLRKLIEGLLNYSRSENILTENKQVIHVNSFFKELKKLFSHEHSLTMHLNFSVEKIVINETALQQIFINLISNSVKYSDKPNIEIAIDLELKNNKYFFRFEDNGRGIHKDKIGGIFNMFEVAAEMDKYGERGNGIGLAMVKKLIEKMEGDIKVKSALGVGTCFTFEIKQDYPINFKKENSVHKV